MTFTKKEIFTFANFLSFLRLLLGIPFWILLENLENPNTKWIVFGLAIFAAITDILDGYFARKYNETTEIGKIIDPLADKVCMGIVVIRLYTLGLLDPTLFFIIIGRDVLIFLGGIIVSKKLNRVLPSNMMGKVTVLVTGLLVLFIIAGVEYSSIYFKSIYWLTFALQIISFLVYALRSIEFLKSRQS